MTTMKSGDSSPKAEDGRNRPKPKVRPKPKISPKPFVKPSEQGMSSELMKHSTSYDSAMNTVSGLEQPPPLPATPPNAGRSSNGNDTRQAQKKTSGKKQHTPPGQKPVPRPRKTISHSKSVEGVAPAAEAYTNAAVEKRDDCSTELSSPMLKEKGEDSVTINIDTSHCDTCKDKNAASINNVMDSLPSTDNRKIDLVQFKLRNSSYQQAFDANSCSDDDKDEVFRHGQPRGEASVTGSHIGNPVFNAPPPPPRTDLLSSKNTQYPSVTSDPPVSPVCLSSTNFEVDKVGNKIASNEQVHVANDDVVVDSPNKTANKTACSLESPVPSSQENSPNTSVPGRPSKMVPSRKAPPPPKKAAVEKKTSPVPAPRQGKQSLDQKKSLKGKNTKEKPKLVVDVDLPVPTRKAPAPPPSPDEPDGSLKQQESSIHQSPAKRPQRFVKVGGQEAVSSDRKPGIRSPSESMDDQEYLLPWDDVKSKQNENQPAVKSEEVPASSSDIQLPTRKEKKRTSISYLLSSVKDTVTSGLISAGVKKSHRKSVDVTSSFYYSTVQLEDIAKSIQQEKRESRSSSVLSSNASAPITPVEPVARERSATNPGMIPTAPVVNVERSASAGPRLDKPAVKTSSSSASASMESITEGDKVELESTPDPNQGSPVAPPRLKKKHSVDTAGNKRYSKTNCLPRSVSAGAVTQGSAEVVTHVTGTTKNSVEKDTPAAEDSSKRNTYLPMDMASPSDSSHGSLDKGIGTETSDMSPGTEQSSYFAMDRSSSSGALSQSSHPGSECGVAAIQEEAYVPPSATEDTDGHEYTYPDIDQGERGQDSQEEDGDDYIYPDVDRAQVDSQRSSTDDGYTSIPYSIPTDFSIVSSIATNSSIVTTFPPVCSPDQDVHDVIEENELAASHVVYNDPCSLSDPENLTDQGIGESSTDPEAGEFVRTEPMRHTLPERQSVKMSAKRLSWGENGEKIVPPVINIIQSPSVRSDLSTSSGMTSGDESDDDDVNGEADQADSLKKAEKRRRKLFFIAQEIMTSEQSFVDVLRLLSQDFRGAAYRVSKHLGHAVIPASTLNQILRYLPELLQLNEELLKDITARVYNWEKYPKIADIFIQKGPFLKLYINYIREFDLSTAILDDAVKKYPEFAKLVADFESGPRCANLALKHYMLRPIQRIPQYRLLLLDYQKHLDPDSIDLNDTKTALQIVCEVVEHANQSMKYGDNCKKLLEIQHSLIGQFEVVKPGRYLIKEGQLNKLSRKEAQPRMFYLLNDVLLYTTPVSGGYKLNNAIPLTGMKITKPMKEGFQNEFNIHSAQRSFTISASTPEEREEWIQKLQDAIQENKEKRVSFHAASAQAIHKSGYCDTMNQIEPDFKLGSCAPVWIPDARVSMCMLCTAEFTVTFRRHHCRACGKVVCTFCSDYQAPLRYLKYKAVRVCLECYDKLAKDTQNMEEGPRKLEGDNFSKSSLMSKFKALRFGSSSSRKSGAKKRPAVLSEVAANADDVDMSGYLKLWSGRKWKRLWFVLKKKVLYIYRASEDTAASESKVLLGYEVRAVATYFEGVEASLLFELWHKGMPPMILRTESPDAKEKWAAAIRRATVPDS